MSHRFCKALSKKIVLSSQYVVACDLSDNGCTGGCERTVYYFMEQYGITDAECHPWKGITKYSNDFCTECSAKGHNREFKKYKAVFGSTRHVKGIENIKKEILLNGPVSASIKTDQGFQMYRGGIYKSSLKGKIEAGNHAVEITGWGIENGTEYWIILNQYGTQWGENGKMKIKMGSNEGLIESFIYSAEPLLD